MAERLTDVTLEELFEKNVVYHRDCCSEVANVEKLDRAKKRYSDLVEYGDSSAVKKGLVDCQCVQSQTSRKRP